MAGSTLAFESTKISEHWPQGPPSSLLLLGSTQCVSICDTFTPERTNKTSHYAAEMLPQCSTTPTLWEIKEEALYRKNKTAGGRLANVHSACQDKTALTPYREDLFSPRTRSPFSLSWLLGLRYTLNNLSRQEIASLGKWGPHSRDSTYCHFKYTGVFSMVVTQSACPRGLDGWDPAPSRCCSLKVCLVF